MLKLKEVSLLYAQFILILMMLIYSIIYKSKNHGPLFQKVDPPRKSLKGQSQLKMTLP